LLFCGAREWRLGSAASGRPDDLSLAALLERGPDGNPHVRIHDFVFGQNFEYFTDPSGASWESVLVPAFPNTMGGQSDHVLVPKLVVKSRHVSNETQVDRLLSRTQLEGMVVNRTEGLDADEAGVLRDDYPGIDAERCIILEEGRQPSDGGMVFLMGGGIALALGGLGLLFYNSNRV